MVCDLKKNKNNSKGILVFTHKEISFLTNKYFTKFLEKEISLLKNFFLIGIHWGWYKNDLLKSDNIDFHMAGKGTLSFSSEDKILNNIIYLCNRNFIDPVFKNTNKEKIYDIITITRPVKFKNNKKIFENIKKIFLEGKKYKFLILFTVPSEKLLKSENFYSEIFTDYNSLFNEEEKKYINLLPIFTNNSEYFLSKQMISDFLNLSKVFLLSVEKEGASRVIHEALLCGLPIITYKHLKGGGLDYLNEKNSELFEDFDKIYLSIIKILENSKNYQVDENYINQELSAENQKIKLKKYFIEFFVKKNISWEGEINFENLDRRLDGHFVEINNKLVQNKTNVIKNYQSFYKYIVSKINIKFSYCKLICCCLLDFAYYLKKNFYNKFNA